MREFLSKSIAGGLSAGVVLLWWPVLFEDVDTVTSWFVRGVAWTVCFELLLFALIPFERALWETAHGERIARTGGQRRLAAPLGLAPAPHGRLSAVATVALAVPVVLLVAGLHKQAPARAEAPRRRPIKVVRVTKVVRPVTVKRIVEQTPVQQEYAPAPQQAAPAPVPPRTTEKPNERPHRRGTAPPRWSARPHRRSRPRPRRTAHRADGALRGLNLRSGLSRSASLSLSCCATRRPPSRRRLPLQSRRPGKRRPPRHGPTAGGLGLRAGAAASIRGRPRRSSWRCCSRPST